MGVADTTVPTKETKGKRDAAARQLQTEQEAKKISWCNKGFALADYISLLGPFDSVITTVRDILGRNPSALFLEHAIPLLSSHPVILSAIL